MNGGSSTTEQATTSLQETGNSEIITIDENKIQNDLQTIRDDSRSSGVEHQMNIVLDRETATVTSNITEPGTNSDSEIEHRPTPSGLNLDNNGDIILSQAHGHPKTDDPGEVNNSGTSELDNNTSASMGITIYAVEAWKGGKNKTGRQSNISRVTKYGAQRKKAGTTKGTNANGSYNIGLESLQLWGGKIKN